MDRGSAVAAHGHGEPCAVGQAMPGPRGSVMTSAQRTAGACSITLHLDDRAAVLTADLVADFVTGWGSEAKIAGGDLA